MDLTSDQRDKLEHYVALLQKWQKTINLVSRNTMKDAWTRHILDSAQLSAYIPPNTKSLIDFGSGAGFPGMVLAMLHPQIDVTLVESDARKCAFLSTVSRETTTPVTIFNERIENITPAAYDVITARALAALEDLIGYSTPFFALNPEIIGLFMKGENARTELDNARKIYTFDHALHKSLTDEHAATLMIKNVSRETG